MSRLENKILIFNAVLTMVERYNVIQIIQRLTVLKWETIFGRPFYTLNFIKLINGMVRENEKFLSHKSIRVISELLFF